VRRLLENPLHVVSRSAAERARERATEIVAEERVEDWVDHAVGVAQNRDELVEGLQPLRHDVRVQRDHLEQPVRQPTDTPGHR